MAGAYDRYDPLSGAYTPADLKKTAEESAAAASTKSNNSFDVTIKMPLTRSNMSFSFWFNYLYQDPDTLLINEGPRSPVVTHGFDVPNLTKGVQNLTLTAGFKSYGVKFTLDPTSIQEDIVIFESLTSDFAQQTIVYVGTSTNVSINTSDFAPRWVKVRSRDKWLTQNNTDVIAIGPDAGGSVIPKNADPDTSTPPSAPTGVSVVGTLDANDKSGFSGKVTASWLANSDTNTSGYVIRWSTQNPATVTNPVWEYGQVDGKNTTTFTASGLLPNTLYYYQVTSKSPYNAISWASPQSGTFGPIVDANAPADVFAQLRSVLSIGGKTADLFKIGTGISQSINTSTTITPSQTAGTYSGIILNKSTTNFGHNYWLNTGQFRVGSDTSFLYWDGSNVYTTGKINATGGQFSAGDVQLNGGTLFAGASPTSGARLRFNSSGIFAYNSSNVQTVAITQSDGKIDARQGYIGGWTINASDQTTGTISKNGTILDSSGNITLGDVTGTLPSIVRLSSTDTYRIWVGSQSSSTAKFKVHSDGTLYATGVQISGDITANSLAIGTTYNGTSLTDIKNNSDKGATAVQEGNGVEVNATTKRISKIIASANLPITSGGTNPVVLDNNGLRMLKPGSTTEYTVWINANNGDALFAGRLVAATGTIGKVTFGTAGTSDYFETGSGLGGLGGGGIAIGGIGFKNTSTGGWTTHCYPYWGGGSNYDLGTTDFRWNDTRLSGSLMVGHNGTDGPSSVAGGTGPKIKLFPNGNIFADLLGTTTRAPASGVTLVQSTDGYIKVYLAASSRKYKDNIRYQDTESIYSLMKNLSPVTFNYKPEFSDLPEETHFGLIAEEVHDIQPNNDLVIYKDGIPDSVGYEKIPIYLVGAFKEMANKIDILQARLDALEG
jgi:hypothetical protein